MRRRADGSEMAAPTRRSRTQKSKMGKFLYWEEMESVPSGKWKCLKHIYGSKMKEKHDTSQVEEHANPPPLLVKRSN